MRCFKSREHLLKIILEGSIGLRAELMKHGRDCSECWLEIGRVIDEYVGGLKDPIDRRNVADIIVTRLEAAERLQKMMVRSIGRLHHNQSDLPN